MIKDGLDFVWDTPNGVGVWSMDEEMLDLMKRSGCVNVNFPVESGSQRVVTEIIRKPLKLTRVKRLTDYCRKIKLGYTGCSLLSVSQERLKKTFGVHSNLLLLVKFVIRFFPLQRHIRIQTFLKNVKTTRFLAENFLDELFIRNYLIQTKEWSGEELKKYYERVYFI